MTPQQAVLWVALPYVAMAVGIVGHIWRYRHDKFGWTSRSTQLLESRWLAWGSNLFHYGALAAIGGHVLGILVPEELTAAVGVTEAEYRLLAASAGTLAGVACVAGLVILTVRRLRFPRIRHSSTPSDGVAFVLLFLVIGLGITETLAVSTFGSGYDYRPSVGAWFRSLFIFNPQPNLIASAPLIYQLHAISAWLLYAAWPFTRLVHVWSLPLQFLGRPHILYRSRSSVARR